MRCRIRNIAVFAAVTLLLTATGCAGASKQRDAMGPTVAATGVSGKAAVGEAEQSENGQSAGIQTQALPAGPIGADAGPASSKTGESTEGSASKPPDEGAAISPGPSGPGGEPVKAADERDDLDGFEDPFAGMQPGSQSVLKPIADPIEPFNRAMFHFNDKLYFWVLKPASQGYSFIVPEKGRVAVRRFFTNLATPIRFVNSVLQLKFKAAGTELERFCINTTIGVLGFTDPARDRWNIYLKDEDFGQTLGRYGAGPGFYITLPIFGPSSARDTVGLVADFFLDPVTYLFANHPKTSLEVWSGDKVNSTSLNIGLYEGLKKEALDPYSFIRDSYHQYREKKVRE